jgi:hypothetical protein
MKHVKMNRKGVVGNTTKQLKFSGRGKMYENTKSYWDNSRW